MEMDFFPVIARGISVRKSFLYGTGESHAQISNCRAYEKGGNCFCSVWAKFHYRFSILCGSRYTRHVPKVYSMKQKLTGCDTYFQAGESHYSQHPMMLGVKLCLCYSFQ